MIDNKLKSKFDVFEIVEVELEAIKSQCLVYIKNGCMHPMTVNYLLEYPVATIKNKELSENEGWKYLVEFLDCEAEEMYFMEKELRTTGTFTKPNKFNCYEIVKIVNPSKENKKFRYLKGVVTAMSQDRDGLWGYIIHFLQKHYDSCDCNEYELESTGNFAKEEDLYTNEHIKVIVNPDGRGELKNNC